MYTSFKEIEITKNSELVQEFFEAEYLKRFGVKPFVEDGDLVVFAMLSKNYGLEKSRIIVSCYLAMQDKWFAEQGYTPSVLRKNLNKVLIAAAPRLEGSRTRDKIRIATYLMCDCCGQYYRWIGYPEDLEKPRYCETCISSGESEAPLTKEDLDELSKLLEDEP